MGLLDRLRPSHPVTCTCAKCVEARLKRVQMQGPIPRPTGIRRARPWTIRMRRTRRFIESGLRWLVILVVIVLLLSYIGVVGVHLTNGFDFSNSFSMSLKDYRVIVTCPTNADVIWAFIDRSEAEELQQQIAQERGEDIYTAACEADDSESDAQQVSPTPAPAVSGTPSPVPTILATTGPTSTGTAPTPTITSSPAPITQATPPTDAVLPSPTSDPRTVLETLVLYMLDLINEDRAENGLDPVVLGTNTAAQQHAEEMLNAGYLAHWNLDGLKPYMRYTLAGGFNYEGENVSGPPYYTDPDTLLHQNVLDLLKNAQEGLMNSPGHRRNILDKWHKKVNIGIAFNDAS